MKIIVNTGNYELFNSLSRTLKEIDSDSEIVLSKFENAVKEYIDMEVGDAYILSSSFNFTQKMIDFINKYYSYIPVVVIGDPDKFEIKNADVVFPYTRDIDKEVYSKSILNSIFRFVKNYEILQKLTASTPDIIEFEGCKYDPATKNLYFNDKLIAKLSPKQAGILEIIASNYGKVVKKDIILEKVWRESNYFTSRSLDVFMSHLRKIFKTNDIPLVINNLPEVGIMLGHKITSRK